MTLTQLEYVLAIAETGSFVEAADQTGVTQPALTTQIKNLENELDTIIFDRTKKPVIPTEIGLRVIDQAGKIIQESKVVADLVNEHRNILEGTLKLGIIPTVSQYLLPQFIQSFTDSYPDIHLHVKEMITEDIIHGLKNGSLDAGIIATPIEAKNIKSMPLYYEKFYGYVSREHPLYHKTELTFSDLNESELWLLKEGNCFRDQVLNICSQAENNNSKSAFKYESHSIESLMRVVEMKNGVTLIPELAAKNLTSKRSKLIREIPELNPMREISIVVRKQYLKKRFVERLRKNIISNMPDQMLEKPQGILVDPNVKL